MNSDSRLKWIHANRSRRDPVRGAGSAIESIVQGACRAAASRNELEQILAGATDPEFQRFCSMGRVESGTLVVQVKVPTLVSVMRRRWSEPLLRTLRNSGKQGRSIRRLLFEYNDERIDGHGTTVR